MIPLSLIPFENLKLNDNVRSYTGRLGKIVKLEYRDKKRLEVRDPDEFFVSLEWDYDPDKNNHLSSLPHYLSDAIKWVGREESYILSELLIHPIDVFKLRIVPKNGVGWSPTFSNIAAAYLYLESKKSLFIELNVSHIEVEDRSVFPYVKHYINFDRHYGTLQSIL